MLAAQVTTGHNLHDFRNRFGKGRKALEDAIRKYKPSASPAPYRRNLVDIESNNLTVPKDWLSVLPRIEALWAATAVEIETVIVKEPKSTKEVKEEEVKEEEIKKDGDKLPQDLVDASFIIEDILKYHCINQPYNADDLLGYVTLLAKGIDPERAEIVLKDIQSKTSMSGAKLIEALNVTAID